MLIANDVSKAEVGFGYDTNQVTILTRDAQPETLPLQTKIAVAREIMRRVTEAVKD